MTTSPGLPYIVAIRYNITHYTTVGLIPQGFKQASSLVAAMSGITKHGCSLKKMISNSQANASVHVQLLS